MTQEEELLQKIMAVNCLTWAHHKKLQLGEGVNYTLKNYPFHAKFNFFDKKEVSIKKGTQIGETTKWFIYALHACLHRVYDKSILYMMPTEKLVERTSKVAFDPLIRSNPGLGGGKKGSNTTFIKQFGGRTINFVGAQPQSVGGSDTKDSANLRGISCDLVIRDEIDLMDDDMVEMSRQRLNASDFRHQANFASPTIEDYGIDYLYNQSDMRKWQIKCRHCGKYTCLAQEFPDSIIQTDGKWIRSCIHCRKEIYVADGDWVADYPDRRSAGYWVSGLLSPKADLDEYMFRYYNTEGTKRAEFMRSILGIAVTEADSQISRDDVLRRCGNSRMVYTTTQETAMGIDVGSTLHVVVGVKRDRDSYEILLVKECKDFQEIHDIAMKMNVKSCVIDAGPDIHRPKEFRKEMPFPVWRCRYAGENNPGAVWKGDTGLVSVNRNEWCDKVRDVLTSDTKMVLPHAEKEIREYATQMTKMVKSVDVNDKTGIRKPRWHKRGDKVDHYFHATLYFLVAASRIVVSRTDGQPTRRYTKCKNNYTL